MVYGVEWALDVGVDGGTFASVDGGRQQCGVSETRVVPVTAEGCV